MTTVTDLYNRALAAIGTRTTVTDAEIANGSTNEAVQLSIIYANLRDDLLRRAPWDCALRTANLTYITSTPGTPENTSPATSLWQPGQPAPPWAYEYQYPVDCLRACWMIPAMQTGFASGVPITTAVTGGASSFWQGQPIKFKVQTDKFRPVTAAAVVSGGTGHAVGDVITLASNLQGTAPIGAPAQLLVTAALAGVITAVSVVNVMIDANPAVGGSYFNMQANPVAQGSTTGVGVGATFNLTQGLPAAQRVILTNQEFASLSYIAQVTDPNLFDTLFQSALSDAMAAEVCQALTGDKKLVERLINKVNEAISAARSIDGNEGLTINDTTPDWIRIRGIGWTDGYVSGPYTGYDWGNFWELRMSDLHIQASFNSGEWSPTLYARVDLAKYRSGAALLENFFVDYRGGASTRPGTKYILQAYKSATAVRLISFQASFNVGYMLEFGEHYIRPFFLGAPILETGVAITGATKANPCVLTIPGNTYVIGDWILVTNVVGMTELNGHYFSITNVAGSAVTIANLNGTAINSTTYGTYISGGTASRVYVIPSPYAAADLANVKFAQNVNEMILCHPNYPPYILTLISAANWTMVPISFGTSAVTPSNLLIFASFPSSTTPPPPNLVAYGYCVTSVDSSGQESAPAYISITNQPNMQVNVGTITIFWNLAVGAVGYNVYKTLVSYSGNIPAGATYGYIGTSTGNNFNDTNIAPDYTQTPPVVKNPFGASSGFSVQSVTVTVPGVYTTVPVVSFSGASPTIPATANAILGVTGTPTVAAGGSGYAVGDSVLFSNNVVLIVATVSAGAVATWKPITTAPSNPGAISGGSTPANPVAQISTSGTGTGATANLTWGVNQVQMTNNGAGYSSLPSVVFSTGAATAEAVQGPTTQGYPSLPGFFQQRLVLAAPNGSPQTFYMSQPGAYFNFNGSVIVSATDAITGTLVSGQLNTIKSMVPQTSGLLILTDRASWIVNGGSPGVGSIPFQLGGQCPIIRRHQ